MGSLIESLERDLDCPSTEADVGTPDPPKTNGSGLILLRRLRGLRSFLGMELDDPLQFASVDRFFPIGAWSNFSVGSNWLFSIAVKAIFSSSASIFRRWSARRELHFPVNRSLAGDSLRDEDIEAAPPQQKPKPPEDEESWLETKTLMRWKQQLGCWVNELFFW